MPRTEGVICSTYKHIIYIYVYTYSKCCMTELMNLRLNKAQ